MIARYHADLSLTTTKGEPRIDSRLLAQHMGVKHRNSFALLKDHRADFEQFGILRFQTEEIDGRGQPEKFALLNEDQSYLLLTYSRNTARVRALKVRLVKAFGEARRARDTRQVEYMPTYHALHDEIAALAAGSERERFIHMNFNRLLNKVAGIDAGQRPHAPLPVQSMLVVAQMMAANALRGASDHHEAYERAKAALAPLARLGDAQ